MGNHHIILPCQLIDMTENIIFSQLSWQVVNIIGVCNRYYYNITVFLMFVEHLLQLHCEDNDSSLYINTL